MPFEKVFYMQITFVPERLAVTQTTNIWYSKLFTEVWETKTLCCTEDGCNASIQTVSPPTISLIAFVALLTTTTTFYITLGSQHHLEPRLLPWSGRGCLSRLYLMVVHSAIYWIATILKQFNKMFWISKHTFRYVSCWTNYILSKRTF